MSYEDWECGRTMRVRGTQRDNVYQRERRSDIGSYHWDSNSRTAYNVGNQMKKSELKKIAEIAMIAALVGVAVEYFIRPAATNAAKSVT